MSRGFDFVNHADIWTPLATVDDPDNRAAVYYVVARLRDGVRLEAAQADIDRVAEQLRTDFPEVMGETERVFIIPYLDQLIGNVRPALLVLAGAVGVVLLIACANLANLLLARATRREREFALRVALGAGRGRIVRQLITESAVLATVGGALGLAAAHWGLSLLISFRPSELPRLDAVHVDARVLGFTMLVTLFTVVLFGLPPALRASRIDLNSALKEGGGGAVGAGRGRAREILIVGEVALAMVLLVGASLLINSFLRLTRLDPGYDYQQTLTMKMSFGGRQDLTSAEFAGFARQVKEHLEALPGVEKAGTISTLPLEHGLMGTFRVPGQEPADSPDNMNRAQWRVTTPGYFEAMGIPLLRGRDFEARDTPDSEQVIIINNDLARQAFPDTDPVGQSLVTGGGEDSPPVRIVGVVGDVSELALDRAPTPTLFVPASQMPDGVITFLANLFPTCWVVRTRGEPMGQADAIQAAILAVDREQPVSRVRTMEQIMGESIAGRRFSTLLLTVFAGQALLLAIIGIYGVMSYSVAQRTRETGIRMAIGATRGSTLRLILGQGARWTGIGVVLGSAGALGLTRLMQTQLYEVSVTDAAAFAVAAVAVVLAATSACLIPALRATRIDPIIALREE
jgi:predicted permease